MPEYNIDRKSKVEANEQNLSFHPDRSHSESPGREMKKYPVLEKTFHPARDRHLSALNAAGSAAEIADILEDLQQTYGNQYVQSLVKSVSFPGSPVSTLAPVAEEEELQASPSNKQPVMVPVDPSKCAGCVIVRNGRFDIYLNENTPDILMGGVIAHEIKHVEDFENDPDYMTIPTLGPAWMDGPIPDGETFYYRNMDDARMFENAAIDVEIAWLERALEQDLEPEDRRLVVHRKDVVLPAYRASFG